MGFYFLFFIDFVKKISLLKKEYCKIWKVFCWTLFSFIFVFG